MVEELQILKQIQKQIDELTEKSETKKEHKPQKDVVLFFSFDIVNSTLYKTINYYGWAQVLNLMFKEIKNEVQIKIPGSEMWRILGDEVIFIKKVSDEKSLCEHVNKIFDTVISIIFKLKEGKFFQDEDYNLMKLQNILSLKATAWIAAISNVGDINNDVILEEDIDNIFEKYQSQNGHQIFEFLGNDIDTGFRVAQQSQDGRLAISFELAYLISRETESLSCLHIITYKKLKGVWKNRLYPIIWYHNPKTYLKNYEREINLEESFDFDACDESELIKEYYDNRESKGKIIRDIKMFTETNYALNKILQDRGLKSKTEKLRALIKDSIKDQTKFIDVGLMELHCVAVCFKKENDEVKILVAQRTEERENYKGRWEFGCAKATRNTSIEMTLKEEYKNDFQIDIKPILDENRTEQQPVPIALYSVEKSKRTEEDKGIITLAEIQSDLNPSEFCATEKHKKLEWVKETDLPKIDTDFPNQVPDFKQTLEAAFEKIKELGI